MNRKIFNNLCAYAQQAGLESLAISEGEKQVTIDGYQANGESRRLLLPKKLEEEFFSNLQKIFNIQPGELISEKSGQIKKRSGAFKYRLSTLPGRKHEKIIINLIKPTPELWRLNQLGLSRADRQDLKLVLQKNSGLIILSSPFGQGKSSTLRSLLLNANSDDLVIYSLDNHPLYKLPGVNLLPAKPEYLEKILQHDADWIFIDDLDQPGMLEAAVRAASTGRLVIGTLVAKDVFEAYDKIQELNLPLRLKLESVKLIINQRLAKLRRRPKLGQLNQRQTIGLFEVLKLSPTIKKTILSNQKLTGPKRQEKIKAAAIKEGFKSWTEDKAQKIKEGLLWK